LNSGSKLGCVEAIVDEKRGGKTSWSSKGPDRTVKGKMEGSMVSGSKDQRPWQDVGRRRQFFHRVGKKKRKKSYVMSRNCRIRIQTKVKCGGKATIGGPERHKSRDRDALRELVEPRKNERQCKEKHKA